MKVIDTRFSLWYSDSRQQTADSRLGLGLGLGLGPGLRLGLRLGLRHQKSGEASLSRR